MRTERGFSLAELLVVCAVIGVIMAALLVTLQAGQTAYLMGAGRVEVQQSARVALDRMIRELRAGQLISVANPTSITFQFRDETTTLVTVQYSVSGAALLRNQTVPVPALAQPETLIGGVNALTFTYYDVNEVTTTVAANARAVDILLTTQPEDTTLAASAPANRRAVVADRVRLRNVL